MTYAIITIIIVLIIIFYWLILPLFKYFDKTSSDILKAALPGLLGLDKTIITICSAAIVLTINLINKSVIGRNYLITSWFGLITCIGVGVIILLACYTESVIGRVFIDEFVKFHAEPKNITDNEKSVDGQELRKVFNHHILLNKVLIVLIYLLVSSLFISFLFMIIFGLKNL